MLKHPRNMVIFRIKELERLTKLQEKTKQAMLNVMEDFEEAKAITEQEKAKSEAMLASIGEGLIAVNMEGKIMIINKAAEKMLGWNENDLLGKDFTSLPLEDEQNHLLPLDKRPTYIALSTGKMINNTYVFVRKDKTRFPITITVTPIKLNGKIIGAIDIFRDITREKKIDQEKTEFVCIASHQLRTPLGITKWYLEVLIDEGYLNNAPKIVREYLDVVYKNNERLLALVRGLLCISRIDQETVINAPQITNIMSVLNEVINNMTILAAKHTITLRLDVKKSDIPAIFADPLKVQEVIKNLLTNAITYSNASEMVDIIVDQKDKKVIITVKDTGVGISGEDKKKLFTKFFRSEKAIVKNTEGSGLGLYVVKKYVNSWNGDISVETSEGKGSTFSVTLPLGKNKQESIFAFAKTKTLAS